MAEDTGSVNAKKTTVTFSGTVIGSLIGPIPLPEIEVAITKHRNNFSVNPKLVFGDEDVSDIELDIDYISQTQVVAMMALKGTAGDLAFTLANNDVWTFGAGCSKVSPVAGDDNGACIGKIGFVCSHFVSSTPSGGA